jgi:hypothetical protein
MKLAVQDISLICRLYSELVMALVLTLRNCSTQIYGAVCRAATLLTTRFTGTAFWMAGLLLFESAAAVVSRSEEKKKISGFIKQANERDELVPPMRAGPSKRSST